MSSDGMFMGAGMTRLVGCRSGLDSAGAGDRSASLPVEPYRDQALFLQLTYANAHSLCLQSHYQHAVRMKCSTVDSRCRMIRMMHRRKNLS